MVMDPDLSDLIPEALPSKQAPLRQQAVLHVGISKQFANETTGRPQLFRGVVAKYHSDTDDYLVVYEDGDREDLEWHEILRYSPVLVPDELTDVAGGGGGTQPPSKLPKKSKGTNPAVAAAALLASALAGLGASGGSGASGKKRNNSSKGRKGDESSKKDEGKSKKEKGRSKAFATETQQQQQQQQEKQQQPQKQRKQRPTEEKKHSRAGAEAEEEDGPIAAAAPKAKKRKLSAATAAAGGGDITDGAAEGPSSSKFKGANKAAADAAAVVTHKPQKSSKASGAGAAAAAGGGGSARKAKDGSGGDAAAAAKQPGSNKQEKQQKQLQQQPKEHNEKQPKKQKGETSSRPPQQPDTTKQKQQKEKQPAAAATTTTAPGGAAAAAAGGAGAGSSKQKQPPQPPIIPPLPAYGPGRVTERAWRLARAAATVGDLAGVRERALKAAQPVKLKDGRPMFAAQPEDLPGALTPEAAKALLIKTAVKWGAGAGAGGSGSGKKSGGSSGIEPYHRHVLAPHIMSALLDPKSAAEGVAAAAAQLEVRVSHVKKKAVAVVAPAAAAGGEGEEGGEEQQQQGGDGGGKKKKQSKKDQQQQKEKGGGSKQQQKQGGGAGGSSKQQQKQQQGAAAAAAAAGDKPQEEGGGGGEVVLLERVERQYVPLWVASAADVFADPCGSLAKAVSQTRVDYDKVYREAVVSEERRYVSDLAAYESALKMQQGSAAGLSKPSRRADRVAESVMMKNGWQINDRGGWGHVPGCAVNQKFDLRAVSSLMGMHKSPISGMVAAHLPHPVVIDGVTYDKLQAVTSVVGSGVYMSDQDAHEGDQILVYTGQGGNDLLSDKSQIDNQKLERANRHMLTNLTLGIPVRYIRRNEDPDSTTGSVLIYDGLYDVVSCCRQWVPAKDKAGGSSSSSKQEKKVLTFVYGLRRRPGQPDPLSKPISHWKAIGTAKTKPTIERRAGGICRDVSRGVEGEGNGVVATNEVDDMLPPGLEPVRDKQLLLERRDGRPFTADPRPFTYIRSNTYAPNVPLPKPPKLLLEGTAAATAAADRIRAAAAAGSSSGCGQWVHGGAPLWSKEAVIVKKSEVVGEEEEEEEEEEVVGSGAAAAAGAARSAPHKLLARLNGGHLPYTYLGGKKNVWVASDVQRVLIECGDWTGCKDRDCQQRQAHRPLQYRLEVYKTEACGWGVQSWDPIAAGSLVCVMLGHILRSEDIGHDTTHGWSAYAFELAPRPELDHRGRRVVTVESAEEQEEQEDGQAEGGSDGGEEKSEEAEEKSEGEEGEVFHNATEYLLCARDQGNVARFINHCCEPNLYVQPLLAGHTDTEHVMIGLFAARDIPPFTPLSYDYGPGFIEHDLKGNCLCGAPSCYSIALKKQKNMQKKKAQQQQQQQQVGDKTAAAAAAAAGKEAK